MIEEWGEPNVRDTFAETARSFAGLVRRLPPDRWDGSGLGEWNLRALVGHTSRALVTVQTYLGRPVDTEDVPTPAAYYLAIAGIDQAAVASRGVQAGRELGEDPAGFVDALAERVVLQVNTAAIRSFTPPQAACISPAIFRLARWNWWYTASISRLPYQTLNRHSSALRC